MLPTMVLMSFHHLMKVNIYLLSICKRQSCVTLGAHGLCEWLYTEPCPVELRSPSEGECTAHKQAHGTSDMGNQTELVGDRMGCMRRGALRILVPSARLCSLVSSSWVLASLPLLSVSSLMLPNRFSVHVLPIFSRSPLKPWYYLPYLPVAWADRKGIIWIHAPD